MFNIIFVIIFAIIGTISLLIGKDISIEEGGLSWLSIIGMISMASSFIICMCTIDVNFKSYKEQLERFEESKKISNQIALLKEKMTSILDQYKEYLGKIYPEFEKEILGKLKDAESSEEINIHLNYPDLKTPEVLESLVEKISKLVSELYKKKNKLQGVFEDIRVFNKNPWIVLRPKMLSPLKEEVLEDL